MTEAPKPVAVTFLRGMAPYEAGDIAGFSHARAHALVQRRIADFHPATPDTAVSAAGPTEPDILDAMDRPHLVAFGREHLGMRDEPPIEITDVALRHAIRANVDPALLIVEADGEIEDGGEQEQVPPEASKQDKGGKSKP